MSPSQSQLELSTPVQFLPGVGPSRARRLERLGVHTARDALFLFPRSHEFPPPPMELDRLVEGQEASFVGVVTDAELAARSPGKSMFAAIVENDSGAVRLRFFNQPFRAEQLTHGRRILVAGAPKLNGLRMEFVHPKITILDNDEAIAEPRILPVYPLTEGVKQSDLRKITGSIIGDLAPQLVEVMPERLRRMAAASLRETGIQLDTLPGISDAISMMHYPDSERALRDARARLVFQELLVMQLALAMRRRRLTTDLKAPAIEASSRIDARIRHRFPFALTGDQQRAVETIGKDMSRQFPMNRLLQGDVGSGKTVVAIYAMMLAVAGGHQAVLMTPTEVLARQHYQTLNQILQGSRVRTGLLCGSLTASQRSGVVDSVANGEIDLLVGTQSILYGGLEFKSLALCVIDEQHKFGVKQRIQLRSGGIDPHYLVMSATPIPRSMAMTVFGDVELTTLREKPPGRRRVHTYLAQDGWEHRWWDFVRQRLDEGRQAFVVAPRVFDTGSDADTNSKTEPPVDDAFELVDEVEETENTHSVESVFENLANGPLAAYRVELLHGGMPNQQKLAVMEAFAAGEIQVLVSTTVIEVGIDVPNATVMTIFGAQRFGLAQLHQLRGRVGRGTHAGHVCVFTDGEAAPEENERLRTFENTDDGFELAEADFRIRGPGDLLGSKQSGLPPMRIADFQRDLEVLVAARRVAQELVDEDPALEADDLTELRGQLMRRYGKRLDLGDVA